MIFVSGENIELICVQVYVCIYVSMWLLCGVFNYVHMSTPNGIHYFPMLFHHLPSADP